MRGPTVLVIDDSPTILKVVELVLTKAGFTVLTALDGAQGLEIARQSPPDLVVLDFVMPHMNGYQVCRALAQEEPLRNTPVVLMSSKGEQIGERFIRATGVVDYITKPFSPEAMLAVVTHVIGKFAKGVGPSRAEGAEGAADPLSADTAPTPLPELATAPLSTPAEPSSPAGSDDAARKRALRDLRASLANAVGQGLSKNGDLDGMRARIEATLEDATLEPLLRDAFRASADPFLDPEVILMGDLRFVSLAHVLGLLGEQSHFGILRVRREDEAHVDVYFRGGKVELAASSGVSEEYLLGRYVLEQNLMSPQDLELHLQSRRETGGRLLGAQLVQLGYISETDLRQVMMKQTRDLVYEALRWKAGRFTFRSTRELPAAASQAALSLAVEGILMDGFRRVDEWHLIEREIDNFDLVFLRNEDAVAQMGRGRLTREELTVLELVNGKHSVKEIIRHSRMGSFDVSKMLFRLLCIKLIRRRVIPVAV